MTNKEYLDAIVAELMADTEWEFPAELRSILLANLEWGMLGM